LKKLLKELDPDWDILPNYIWSEVVPTWEVIKWEGIFDPWNDEPKEENILPSTREVNE
jgi:hypothetical protein